MLKIKITSAKDEHGTALAAARAVLRRFDSQVDVNGEKFSELSAVLAAEAEQRPQMSLVQAKAQYRAIKQRLMEAAIGRLIEKEGADVELVGIDVTPYLSEEEYEELTIAQRAVDIARHSRRQGQGSQSLVIDVPTAQLGVRPTA